MLGPFLDIYLVGGGAYILAGYVGPYAPGQLLQHTMPGAGSLTCKGLSHCLTATARGSLAVELCVK